MKKTILYFLLTALLAGACFKKVDQTNNSLSGTLMYDCARPFQTDQLYIMQQAYPNGPILKHTFSSRENGYFSLDYNLDEGEIMALALRIQTLCYKTSQKKNSTLVTSIYTTKFLLQCGSKCSIA